MKARGRRAARWALEWQRWLFAPGSLRSLAVFRMGWAVAMLADAFHDWGRADMMSPERYHQPLAFWAVPLDAGAYHALIRIAAIGCLATFVGVLTRVGAMVTSAVNAYLLAADALLFRNHVYLGCLLGFLLVLAPCDRALSIDAVVRHVAQRTRRARRANSMGSPMNGAAALLSPSPLVWAPVHLIQAQVLVVYAWSVVNKLRVPFLDGWTLQQELPYALAESPIASWLRAGDGTRQAAALHAIANDRAMAACSFGAVLTEALLVVGLPSRRLRPYAALAGLVLHCAIFLSMGVFTFGVLMVSSYPLFFARGRDVAERRVA